MSIHYANADKSEQLKLILNALKHGPASTFTLQESSGSMCPATRISELRAQGYIIDCERKSGIYFYTLVGRFAKAA